MRTYVSRQSVALVGIMGLLTYMTFANNSVRMAPAVEADAKIATAEAACVERELVFPPDVIEVAAPAAALKH
jgi:hypothetical protein